MSANDNMERVLRDIHVMLAKCPKYNDSNEQVIVDRRELLSHLDRLNHSVYEMMEQYEQTAQSRTSAERELKRRGEGIIENASAKAEDVYAAAVLYTADMLGRIQNVLDDANNSVQEMMEGFQQEVKEQKAAIRSNQTELESQLNDMRDTQKYLNLIQDVNRDIQREKERKARIKAMGVRRGSAEPIPEDDSDVVVHTDSEYFKQKEVQEAENIVDETIEGIVAEGVATETDKVAEADKTAEADQTAEAGKAAEADKVAEATEEVPEKDAIDEAVDEAIEEIAEEIATEDPIETAAEAATEADDEEGYLDDEEEEYLDDEEVNDSLESSVEELERSLSNDGVTVDVSVEDDLAKIEELVTEAKVRQEKEVEPEAQTLELPVVEIREEILMSDDDSAVPELREELQKAGETKKQKDETKMEDLLEAQLMADVAWIDTLQSDK